MTQEREHPTGFRVGSALRSLCATLLVGSILFFYSETLFWGRPGRAPLPELTVTWLIYSLLTYLMLSALTAFRVQGWATLFLAGALYGWLGEGVLVQTMYDQFPLQISWTGLAWHALLSVCLGWAALNLALQKGFLPAALVSSAIGIFWGVWAVMWWQPAEGGRVTPLPAFASHTFGNAALLVLAFALYPRLVPPGAFTSRAGRVVVIGLAVVWFALVAVPKNPLALAVAPPLFALTLHALSRHRRQYNEEGFLSTLRPLPWHRYLPIFAMPLCAVAVYGLFLATGRLYATNIWVFKVVTPAGFLAYLASLIAIYRNASLRRPPA